jgi:hypothetical protein
MVLDSHFVGFRSGSDDSLKQYWMIGQGGRSSGLC